MSGPGHTQYDFELSPAFVKAVRVLRREYQIAELVALINSMNCSGYGETSYIGWTNCNGITDTRCDRVKELARLIKG